MSAKTPTIYVDMDDVLCHTARRFLDIVERQFGKQIVYDQLTDFDIGHACSLRPEEREELYRIVHESKELLNLQPIDAAVDVVRQWQALGYDIAIVTGRPPESHDVSLEWLA